MCKSLLMSLVGIGFLFQLSTVQAENTGGSSLLISETTYKNLPSREQKKYIREARKHYYEFETVLNKDMKFVEASYNKYQFAMALLLDKASAFEQPSGIFCVLGGNKLSLNNGLCPISETICKTDAAKFQCSNIYSEVCVEREPRAEISKRCYENSKHNTDVDYEGLKERYNSIYQSVCVNDNNLEKLAQEHVAACHYLRVKMDKLNEPLEKKLRAELDACKADLVDANIEIHALGEELNQCKAPSAKPTAAVEVPSPEFECEISDNSLDSRKQLEIGNIYMFKRDSRMVRLLSNTQNVNSISISYENGKSCFTFNVSDSELTRFQKDENLINDKDLAQVTNGKIKGCTGNGVELIDGKLFVPALRAGNNFVTFKTDSSASCRLGADRLKKIKANFKYKKPQDAIQ